MALTIEKWESRGQLTLEQPWRHRLVSTGFVPNFNEGSGLDLTLFLDSCPRGYLDFAFESQYLVACPQPELTAREHSFCYRPDWVVNSVAFYHPQKRNNEYGTGKIGHLYRHKLWDSAGHWTWTNWTVERFGLLRLWLDKTFLRLGTPPFAIRPVGDTFGYTTAGASGSTVAGSGANLTMHGAITYTPNPGVATNMNLNCGFTGSACLAQGGMYSGTAKLLNGTTQSGNVTTDYTSRSWVAMTFVVNPTLLAVPYWLCWQSNAQIQVSYDANAVINDVQYDNNSNTFPSWANMAAWINAGDGHWQISIYSTYTGTATDVQAIPLGLFTSN